jgi:hypothetical protein
MSRFVRFLIPLAIFFSGVILIPYFSWPDEAFSWQNFANAYGYGYGTAANR